MEELRTVILNFYNQLEEISQVHEELTDTDVREDLAETLHYYFVWGKPMDRLPSNYSMFSKEGDELISIAVNDFLKTAREIAESNNKYYPLLFHIYSQ